MSADQTERIRKLEAEVASLKSVVKPGPPGAHELGLAVAVVAFLIIVSKLPFPGDPSFWPRAGIAVGCLIVAGVVYSGALSAADYAFKMVVEIAGALLFLGNAVYGALVWLSFSSFKQMVINRGITQADEAGGVVVLSAALLLMLLNLVAMLILHPAAKVAGTKLDL